jgi:hypothetical protein
MTQKTHAIKVGSNWIGGILKANVTNQARVVAEPTAGSFYPQRITINEIKQTFGFSTNNVATALGLVGFLGLGLGSGVTIEVYEILTLPNGTIAPGTVHRKLAFGEGRIIPKQLACQHRADATLDLEVMGLSTNGTASPMVITESVAVPAALDDARHTLGNCTVSGIDVGCLQSLSMDFGLAMESAGCKSNIYDTRIKVSNVVPKVTVTTEDCDIVGDGGSQIPLVGKPCTHANTSFRLRKRTSKVGTFVADATTEHIRITCDGVVVPTNVFEASANEDGSSTLEVTGMFDGTNLPFVINTASAHA